MLNEVEARLPRISRIYKDIICRDWVKEITGNIAINDSAPFIIKNNNKYKYQMVQYYDNDNMYNNICTQNK